MKPLFEKTTVQLGTLQAGTAMHFKSEYHRRKFAAGEMHAITATKEVPIYRGAGIDAARSIRADLRRKAKADA